MNIVIIKLSALGDVLRTTSLLPGLKRGFNKSIITWVTDQTALDLLKKNQYIDRIFAYNPQTISLLKKCSFDILICLDKEIEAVRLAMEIEAKRKIGFGLDKNNRLCPLNKESEYAYRLGISDELKFKVNQKNYPEIIYDMVPLKYKKDKYILRLEKQELEEGQRKLQGLGINGNDFIIGLNTGAGTRFANKAWPLKNYLELIKIILSETKAKIVLLGGEKEKEINRNIESLFEQRVYNSGANNALREFAAIISHCDIVVSPDTLAMHIGIALDKHVLALFGPTCHQEIELYGKGAKIASSIECSPCYKRHCAKQDNCMSRISGRMVFEEIEKII